MTAITKTPPDNFLFNDAEWNEQATPQNESAIENQSQAESHLQALAYHHGSLEAIQNHAAEQRAKIIAWETCETEKIQRRITWHQNGLQAFLWNTGLKTMNLIHGTLKRIAARESVVITDEDALRLWAASHPQEVLRPVKPAPDKRAILALVKSTGEMPDGCEIEKGEDSFSVTFA